MTFCQKDQETKETDRYTQNSKLKQESLPTHPVVTAGRSNTSNNIQIDTQRNLMQATKTTKTSCTDHNTTSNTPDRENTPRFQEVQTLVAKNHYDQSDRLCKTSNTTHRVTPIHQIDKKWYRQLA